MRSIYSAQFDLGSDGPAPIEDVVKLVENWLFEIDGRPEVRWAPKVDHPFFGTGSSGDGANVVETVRWTGDDSSGWAFRWTQPEADEDYPAMYTEVVLREAPETLSCSIHLGYSRALAVGKAFSPHRPKVVPLLIEKFAAKFGLPVSTRHTVVEILSIPEMMGVLQSPDRRLPAIILSCATESKAPACDPAIVADVLSGIAHVFHLSSLETEEAFSKIVGKEHSCTNGGAKLYWPGWKPSDNPSLHRSFLSSELEPQPATNTYRAANRFLEIVASTASAYPHPWPAEFSAAKLKLTGLERSEEIKEYEAQISQRDDTIKLLLREKQILTSKLSVPSASSETKPIKIAVLLGPGEKGPRRGGWEKKFEELSRYYGVRIEWEFFPEKWPPNTGFQYWILDSKTFEKHKDTDHSFQDRVTKAGAQALSLNSYSDLVLRIKLDRSQAGS